jgi:2-oxoacid:acceptor oxidoreductase gamma subunit (pyruvate/2-ketoisovalerate family)
MVWCFSVAVPHQVTEELEGEGAWRRQRRAVLTGSGKKMARQYDEIRFHGRGGQGIVTASALLSQAFFYEGKYPQSVPVYGPQRRGAPVVVFLRVADERIFDRSWIYHPVYVVVLDDSLIKIANVTQGVPKGGTILVNTAQPTRDALNLDPSFKVAGVDADEIAYRLKLGGPPYPNINVLMLAAFSKITGLVTLESVVRAANAKFPQKDNHAETGMQEAFERAQLL